VLVDKAELDGNLHFEVVGDSVDSFVIERSDLYNKGVHTEPIFIPYIDATLDCTVLPLRALLADYPKMDTIMAYCYDGYVSYYPMDFVEQYEPYIVLDIEGVEQGSLKLEGEGAPDMGPFYITFAKPLKQGSPEMPDPDNKRPYGVYKLAVGSQEDLVGLMFQGAFAELSESAASGRQLWLNNCMSCHTWGQGGPGGDLSNRTSQILSIHAKYNKQYFHDFIKDPHVTMPDAKMPKHPHYDDETIENIRQFLLQVPD
jgi:cytochrome c2